jgi:hypothetical protein
LFKTGATTFPGVTEAITLDEDFEEANLEIRRLSAALDEMAENLEHLKGKKCHKG